MKNKDTDNSKDKAATIGKIPPQELIRSKKELYEVLRVEDRIPLFIDDHLLRLRKGFAKLNLVNNFPLKELKQDICRFIKTDDVKNNNIKISCFFDKRVVSQYYIYTIPTHYPDANMYAHGVQTAILYAERNNPNIKIGRTPTRLKADDEIQEKQVHEVLLVNQHGMVTEGSRSNIFFIVKDTIYTAPPHEVLEGVMRKKVLEIIEQHELKLKLECFPSAELSKANAAFITGTSPRILPISHIDAIELDVNDALLRLLMGKLSEMIKEYKTNPKLPKLIKT